MNCDVAREKLVDLAYGELGPAERQAVEQHIAACPACRAEWEKLRFARSALAESLAGEPAAAFDLPPAAGRPRGPYAAFRSRWGIQAAAALAAAAMVLLGVWVFHDTGPEIVAAQPGPPEILRLGVSLTILSQPEGWATSLTPSQMPMQQQLSQVEEPMQYGGQVGAQGNQVLINPQIITWQGGRPVWRGLALVRDQRVVRRLRRGRTQVRFRGVPSGILPDTVRLRSLLAPDALAILEQNYQYDLASAAAVLQKHVDKPVTALFKDGRSVAGTLLSFDERSLVVQPAGEGPRTLTREELRAVRFAELPAGLLTRPTLVWELSNQAADRQQFEVAYLTAGLTWRADYVLKLHPAGRMAAAKAPGQIADVIDTADLIGYATVNNSSGVSYEQAQLKLMAGDVNLIKPPRMAWYQNLNGRLDGISNAGERPVMTEKSFFEYHLYTVTRPTTLRDAETKQLEMVSGSGLKLTRGYVYNPAVHKTAVRVVSELMNSEANGLGKPLPKGVVRLYAPDPTGVQTYVSKTTIDHTPKDEKLRLPWGYAFDIACSARDVDYRRRGNDHSRTWVGQIRNHKPHDVNVTVQLRVPKSTYRGECKDFPWHVRQVGLVEIDVPVRADQAADVTFAYKWNPRSGGGLTSPHDK